jgi:photosystem II stability/assembly factor-like uncharacterized protein
MSLRLLIRACAFAALPAVLTGVCTSPARATGWAVGGNGLVIRSADGGQSWTSSPGATATLNAVHFVSDNVGWAVGNGGIAIQTTDGGDHWSQTSPGSLNLNGVFFIDENQGWMVGDAGKVLRTTNGGATWVTSTPTTVALYDVFFLNENLGWVVGKGMVLRTTNGGALWSHASPSSETLRGVHFANALLGCAVGNNGVVLRSTDGGVSWTSSAPTPSDLYSLQFVSPSTAWAVGEAGAILKSSDGGVAWSTQRESSSTLRSVQFIDGENGWAVGTNGALVQTADGGGHWYISRPAPVTLSGVFFASIPSGVSVTVDTAPTGLSFQVDGVDYTGARTFHWEPGSPHTIATTSPQSGLAGERYVWSGWSNGGAISQAVAPAVSTTYTASFNKQYQLTMTSVANGTTAPASGWFDAGTKVSISATPDPGYGFNGWSGSGSGAYNGWSNPVNVTVNAPITETPSFSTNVTVNVNGNPAGRSFTVDGTTYSTAQTFTWAAGSSHALDAPSPQTISADTRQVFSRWSDSGNASHSVAPVSNTAYTVTFQTQYLLTMQAGAGGSVLPANGWWNAGASVAISAAADSGFYFQKWSGSGSGAYSGSSNPKTIVLNGPVVETAVFAPGTAPAYPTELSMLQNAPNPATTQTDIRYGLPSDSDVTIELFDVAGRRVFQDRLSDVSRGWQAYRLDVAGGNPSLRSGVYFVRVTGAGATRASRMIILR